MLIYNQSFEEHLSCLRSIFECIRISGIILKLSKCEFICPKIKFLGHIITSTNICMDPAKVQAVREFSCPRNKKELQSFIGFCNFYRKFSDHHASMMYPLIDLLKSKSWVFSEKSLRLFEQVKSALGQHVLVHPDFSISFCI